MTEDINIYTEYKTSFLGQSEMLSGDADLEEVTDRLEELQ